MEYVKLTKEEAATIMALLNGILDTCEESTQTVFDINKINRRNEKDVVAYENFCAIAEDSNKAWSILSRVGRKIRV